MMDINLFVKRIKKNIPLLIVVPIITAVASFFLLDLAPKSYRSTAKLATGFTVNNQISFREERINSNETWFKFDNLLTVMRSELLMSMLSYEILIHDLSSEIPFRELDGDAFIALQENNISLDSIVVTLEEHLDKMEVLNPYIKIDSLIHNMLNDLGYAAWIIQDDIVIQRENNSDYIAVSFSSENPHLSAFLVNTLSKKMISYDSLQAIRQSSKSVDFFERLVKEKKKTMNDKTARVDRYKASNQLFGLSNEYIGTGQLLSLEENRIDIIGKIERTELSLTDVNNEIKKRQQLVVETGTNTSTARVLELQAEINRLNQKVIDEGGNDPMLIIKISELRSLLNKELEKDPKFSAGSFSDTKTKTIEELYQSQKDLNLELRIQKAALDRIELNLFKEKQGLSQTEMKIANLNSLELEAETASKEYLQAVEKYNLEKNKALASYSNLQIIQKGLPNNYASNLSMRKYIVALSFLASFSLCLGGIIALEYFDNRIKSIRNFEYKTGSSCLGDIRRYSKKDTILRSLVTENEVTNPNELFIESIRTLRYQFEKSKSRVFLFTSTRESVGKTFTILSLSRSLSLLGKKVLIIDTNFKNNSLTEALLGKIKHSQIEQNATSLESSLITNQDNKDYSLNLINKTSDGNIDIIGSKLHYSSPSEIFVGRDFKELMDVLVKKYNYIFLEGPALNHYSDTKELVDYSEKIVTVFSTNSVFDQSDINSLKFLEKLNGKYMGPILNNVA